MNGQHEKTLCDLIIYIFKKKILNFFWRKIEVTLPIPFGTHRFQGGFCTLQINLPLNITSQESANFFPMFGFVKQR